MRTRRSHVSKASESVVAALNAIAPGDAGHLWEALKGSQSVEKALGIPGESDVDKKYLEPCLKRTIMLRAGVRAGKFCQYNGRPHYIGGNPKFFTKRL